MWRGIGGVFFAVCEKTRVAVLRFADEKNVIIPHLYYMWLNVFLIPKKTLPLWHKIVLAKRIINVGDRLGRECSDGLFFALI